MRISLNEKKKQSLLSGYAIKLYVDVSNDSTSQNYYSTTVQRNKENN